MEIDLLVQAGSAQKLLNFNSRRARNILQQKAQVRAAFHIRIRNGFGLTK
jgi:hypothetical protein